MRSHRLAVGLLWLLLLDEGQRATAQVAAPSRYDLVTAVLRTDSVQAVLRGDPVELDTPLRAAHPRPVPGFMLQVLPRAAGSPVTALAPVASVGYTRYSGSSARP